MAKGNNEVKVTFKAFNQEFNKSMKEMNTESTKLRQEMKLQSEQMKYTATDTDKLQATITGLEKQYDIAQRKTKETADALEQAKKQWSENSVEVKKYESELRRNEIAEQQIANSITRTSESLEKATNSERERGEASSESAQKLEQLQEVDEKLVQSSEKLNAEYELQKSQLKETATESEKLTAQMDNLNASHELAGEKVKNYEQQLEHAKKQYGDSSTEVKEYESKLLEARTAEQELSNEIIATNRSLEEQNDTLKKTAEQLQETGDKMAGIGRELTTKVTAPIAAIGGLAIKIGSDFEAGMSKVAAVSGATGDDLVRLEEKAREMGATTQFSATEAAASLEYMALNLLGRLFRNGQHKLSGELMETPTRTIMSQAI